MRRRMMACLVLLLAPHAEALAQEDENLKHYAEVVGVVTKSGNSHIFESMSGGTKTVIRGEDLSFPTHIPTKLRFNPDSSEDHLEVVAVDEPVLDAIERSGQWGKDYALRASPDLAKAVEGLKSLVQHQASIDGSQLPRREAMEAYFTLLRQIGDECALVYASAEPGGPVKQQAALVLDEIFEQEEKARYLREDIYSPFAFRQMAAASASAVAIYHSFDRQYIGSGVLVGHDLVLTCRHVLDQGDASDLRVHFDYEVGEDGSPRPIVSYEIAPQPVVDGGDLDFVILRLAVAAEQSVPGDKWPVQAFSQSRVPLDHPLYVVGFPMGDRKKIADNAFVLFPFQATQVELARMTAALDRQYKDSKLFKELKDAFVASYKPSSSGLFECFSVRFKGKPAIGADSDTFVVNSGSPVLSKRNHLLVGILFAGSPDSPTAREPGWQFHEGVLPSSLIVARIKSQLSDWESQGIVIKE